MTITLDWDDPENHVIRCEFSGRWNWDDFSEASRQLIAFLETVSYDIYLIVDGRRCSGLPRGTTPFPHLNRTLRRMPNNVSVITVVSDNAFVRKVFSVVRHFYEGNAQLEIMDNIHDARALIKAFVDNQRASVDLIKILANGDNESALYALQQLRDLDWLYDGTLEGVNLSRAHLTGADLFMANLCGVNLLEARLQNASLFLANLEGANLFRANLAGVNFQDANLTGAMLQESLLSDAHLSPCNLTGANLRGARLWSANMQTATLVDAIFNDADLRKVRLSRASASSASFIGAKMQGAQMLFSHFNNAQFNGANLSHADMRRSNLRHASLSNVKAHGAKLEYANLGGADLSGADLTGADLTGTRFNTDTILPDGSAWTPEIDMQRFSSARHPSYWRHTHARSMDEAVTVAQSRSMSSTTSIHPVAHHSSQQSPFSSAKDTRTDI